MDLAANFFPTHWVLVQAELVDHYKAMCWVTRHEIHAAFLAPDGSVRFCRDLSERIEAYEFKDGAAFQVHAVEGRIDKVGAANNTQFA
ncbi:hypothetical protein F183_A21370 [Bryobacterales bacterium F-183]|nr:hypothetical protein F183_A21370 [Bryobacterales bacterium F-183]